MDDLEMVRESLRATTNNLETLLEMFLTGAEHDEEKDAELAHVVKLNVEANRDLLATVAASVPEDSRVKELLAALYSAHIPKEMDHLVQWAQWPQNRANAVRVLEAIGALSCPDYPLPLSEVDAGERE